MRLGTRLRRVENDSLDEMGRCPIGEIGTRTRKRTITSVKPIVVRHEPRVQPRVYTCSRCAGQDPQSSSCGLGQVGELIRDHLEIAFGQCDYDQSACDAYLLCDTVAQGRQVRNSRSEEHTSELQSLMRTSYAVFCLK